MHVTEPPAFTLFGMNKCTKELEARLVLPMMQMMSLLPEVDRSNLLSREVCEVKRRSNEPSCVSGDTPKTDCILGGGIESM